ncbi:nose resistant to fluoxetine protein 6-like isoform X2 [Coccinella septempunctata]|uniref:nose resistant to fluoxetine protein 6-like isoform X2 n=1 Tax=Coccinella septempunctata TaxID=41139 RepID=UPI001D07B898|nr:nose resistant to fluoxetine protein 6-like isoform X2 [Coccinella septempunctata]
MKILIFHIFIVIILCISGSYTDQCLDRIEAVKLTTSKECLSQLTKLCQQKDLLLSFWDSSSRQLHSGLMATNNEDLGNYDQCMSIDDADIKVKYCPFQWATQLPKNSLQEAVALVEEYNHFTPTKMLQNDTFSNIVRFEDGGTEKITLIGSMCIPDGCTPDEFTAVFNPYILPVNYNVKDPTTNCFTKGAASKMSTFEIAATIGVCIPFLMVIACTAFHAWLHNKNAGEPHDFIKAFSVLHNGKKLIEISRGNPQQIQCIHGLRFLSMLWVVAGHTFASSEVLPHFNEKDVEQWRSHLYAQYILAGPYAVDTFFFLSGLLLAYGYMKQMTEVKATKQVKAIPLMILHRYLRLTPAAAALFFVSLSFLKAIGNGPLWIYMVDSINQPCRDYWWRYFFYIQNYSSEICYTQTWYLSADMQMFIVAPIVLIPAAIYYRRKLRLVVYALTALIVLCVGITIGVLYIVDDYKNDYDTHSRLSDYLVGIIGGILLHTCRTKAIKMKKVVNLAAWVVTLVVMLFLVLYLNDVLVNPTKDKTNLFYPIQRPIWCVCILWIVFACHHGYGGIMNKFLSIPCFQIGSKLSYSMYCVHAVVILYNVGSVRSYQFFNDYIILYILFGNIVVCLIVSTIWTLTFEAPMIILNKMLLGKLGSPKK